VNGCTKLDEKYESNFFIHDERERFEL